MRIVAAVLIFASACAASAQQAPSVPAAVPSADTAQPGVVPDAAANAQDKAPTGNASAHDRKCLKHTGSRLIEEDQKDQKAQKDRKCANANGRAHTREDIDQSGVISLQDALRR